MRYNVIAIDAFTGVGAPSTWVLANHDVVRHTSRYGLSTYGAAPASGIGPRTALSVLSGLSVAELAQAVTAQEAGRIVKVPGIGKKTAERLLLELKGKLGADLPLPGAAAAVGDAASDIQQALMALGYNEKDAAAALKALPAGVGVSEGIKLALKSLAK